MTDRSPAPVQDHPQAHDSRWASPPDASFGPSVLFDLTVLSESREQPEEAPEVYYLATLVSPPGSSSPWRTLAGFGGVICAGVGLGLLLALLLL